MKSLFKEIPLISGVMLKIVIIGFLPNISCGQNMISEAEPEKFEIRQDGSKSRSGKTRHWHITPQGDTIVSFLNEQQRDAFYKNLEKVPQSRVINDLPSDPQHPMYGLNLYVPAWDEDYQTNLDFYGSGDVNNDGIIDSTDYNSTITGTDPFNDGTYRGDTDLDGDSGDADDKAIILDYINGNITHINKWELESEVEKESHLENALAIDPTSEISASSSGWLCYDYTNQTFIDFAGVYNIDSSGYADDNGTNLQYDLTHNGIFRIPVRNVGTKTGSGTAHSINNVYFGDPNNQDATEFYDRIYFEPQTDVIQEIGDYSLNDFADDDWYGYSYSNFLQEWGYFGRNLIYYDITTTPPIITSQHPDLVISWTPFDDVEWPEDQVHEFPGDTSVAANGEPSNIYEGTQVDYSDISTQTQDSTCSDVTYTVTRTWDLVAGDYNSGNTPAGTHDQYIDVEDTTPPEWDGENWTDNSGLELIITRDTISTQNPDTTTCEHYTYTKTPIETAEDVCGNENEEEFSPIEFVNEFPYIVSYPVPNGDTIQVPLGGDIHPDSTGWAEWTDPEGGPIEKNYEDELIEETTLHRLWYRTQTAEDPCGTSPDSAMHYVYEYKPTGVEEKVNQDKAYVYPNPTAGNLTINFNSEKTRELKASLYNLKGQKLEERLFHLSAGENKFLFNLTRIEPGIYILQLKDNSDYMKIKKIIKN